MESLDDNQLATMESLQDDSLAPDVRWTVTRASRTPLSPIKSILYNIHRMIRAFSSLSLSRGLGAVTVPAFFSWRAPMAAAPPASIIHSLQSAVRARDGAGAAAAPTAAPGFAASGPSFAASGAMWAAEIQVRCAAEGGAACPPAAPTAAPLSLRGPNTREPRKSNHGARPCSSVRRRRKYRTRVNEHPYIPDSKQKRKKGMDY